MSYEVMCSRKYFFRIMGVPLGDGGMDTGWFEKVLDHTWTHMDCTHQMNHNVEWQQWSCVVWVVSSALCCVLCAVFQLCACFGNRQVIQLVQWTAWWSCWMFFAFFQTNDFLYCKIIWSRCMCLNLIVISFGFEC